MSTLMKGILAVAVPTLVPALAVPAEALPMQINEMGDHTKGEVQSACKKQGGTFTNEAAGSFYCTKGNYTVECNKNNQCVSITPARVANPPKSKSLNFPRFFTLKGSNATPSVVIDPAPKHVSPTFSKPGSNAPEADAGDNAGGSKPSKSIAIPRQTISNSKSAD